MQEIENQLLDLAQEIENQLLEVQAIENQFLVEFRCELDGRSLVHTAGLALRIFGAEAPLPTTEE